MLVFLFALANGRAASTNTIAPAELLTTFQNTPLTFLTEKLLTNDSSSVASTNTSLNLFSVSSTSGQGGAVKYVSDGGLLATNRATNGLLPALGSYARAIALDSIGNVFVAGNHFSSPTNMDFVTAKYRSDGTLAWTNLYGGPGRTVDKVQAIAVDKYGNVCVTGDSSSSPAGTNQAIVTIKYLPDGVPAWTNRFNASTTFNDVPSDIVIDSQSNVCVVGTTQSGRFSFANVVIKYHSSGVPAWTNTFSKATGFAQSTGVSRPPRVAVDGDGNVFAAEYMMAKYQPDGSSVWFALFDAATNDMALVATLRVDQKGNLYATGSTGNGQTNGDYVTIKYGPLSERFWTNRYREPASPLNAPWDMVVDTNENVYVTGSSGTGPHKDYATIKYSSDGTPAWTNRYAETGASSDHPVALHLDAKGNAFVTGFASITNGQPGIATIKYFPDGRAAWTNRYNSGVPYGQAVDATGNVFIATSIAGLPGFEVLRYSAGTEATYSPPTNFTGTDSFEYVVQDNSGVRRTKSARVAVLPIEPSLMAQPASKGMRVGGTGVLSATITGTPPLSYQWRFGDVDLAGETNETFAIEHLTAERAGHYSVVVRNASGSVTSAVATVFVFDLESVANDTASLLFAGPLSARFRLESSETLTDWQTLGWITLTNNPQSFRDSRPSNQGHRFYRAALEP